MKNIKTEMAKQDTRGLRISKELSFLSWNSGILNIDVSNILYIVPSYLYMLTSLWYTFLFYDTTIGD